MKKFLQTAGLVTAGAATLCSTAAVQAEDNGRFWSVSAAVKGFYDDNIYTAPKGPAKEESFGFDISPSIRFTVPLDQSALTIGYQYGLRWYEARKGDEFDQYHLVNLNFAHNFSPRYKLEVSDNFSYSNEPDQTVGAGLLARAVGNTLLNRANADFTAQISNPASLVLSYRNTYVDFSKDGTVSYDLLDRIEHLIGLSFRYQLRPTTVGVLGYQYGINDYRQKASQNDNTSHYVFAGVDHSFSSRLTGSLRAGAQIVDFNDRSSTSSATSPYVDASLKFDYAPNSYVQLGVSHQRMATDALAFDNTISDAETTSVYGTVRHSFTPKFSVNVLGQVQNSDYKSANKDGEGEDTYFGVSVGAEYKFTRWLSGEANYYYDDRDASFKSGHGGYGQEYQRNRIFLGVRFTY